MEPAAGPSDEMEDGFTFNYTPVDDDQPVVAITRAVAWVKDVDVLDLEPLHNVVDTDGLQQFIKKETNGVETERDSNDPFSAEHCLAFAYEGCNVVVSPGQIYVEGR